MVLTEEAAIFGENNCHNTHFCTTSPTLIRLGSGAGLNDESQCLTARAMVQPVTGNDKMFGDK
jgi:hypothetical protein